MTRESIAALRHTFTVMQPAILADKGRAVLVQAARQGIDQIVREQTAREGVRPGVEAYANRPGNPNIDSVQVPGPIVAVFDYRREVAVFTRQALINASPKQSGEWAANHLYMLNGTVVDVLPANLAPTDVITIANPLPFSRRIEIGKTKSGRDFPLRVPNRIYERTAKNVVAPRYGNSARITFTYIDLPKAYVTKGKLSAYYRTPEIRARAGKFKNKMGSDHLKAGEHKLRRRMQKPGSTVRAPAIQIRAL